MRMRLLVVEDDPDLNRQLVSALSDAGYAVDTAFDGEEGHFLGDTEPYDAVVLDLGLPKKDGLSVLEQWRRDDRKMPVLILRARERWSDKVAGMMCGPSPSTWRRFWRACGRCSGGRPGTPETSSNAVAFASTPNRPR
jgi:DNA-binding response OmpR family regulator